MRSRCRAVAAGAAVLATLLGSPAGSAAQSGTVVFDTIDSAALRGNLLGEPTRRGVIVYLPPGYHARPDARYPVLYLLHAYADRPSVWIRGAYQGFRIQEAMDSLTARGALRELIVVMPDGGGRYFGGFYTNSLLAGNWEDFIAREVVAHVDSAYRTIPRPESRGIAGHSMGGYGALKLAMRHPDVFSTVYAMSPCCLGLAGDLTLESPDLNVALRLEAPGPDELEEVGVYAGAPIASWLSHFPLHAIAAYEDALRRLRAIRFDAGRDDPFMHIPETTRALAARLSEHGITHRYEEYDGDHRNRLGARMATRVLPFFSTTLEFQRP